MRKDKKEIAQILPLKSLAQIQTGSIVNHESISEPMIVIKTENELAICEVLENNNYTRKVFKTAELSLDYI